MTKNISYNVKYHGKFKGKINDVIGDYFSPDGRYRFFNTKSGVRYEVPAGDTIFEFGPERELVIQMNMEKEAGQAIR